MKTCFVIMPIKQMNTKDYDHFKSLYRFINQAVTAGGYMVQRADHIPHGGSIPDEIFQRLASADVVVADLTELNPNVLYELAVRHTLRRTGTTMICDSTRTPLSQVPSDVGTYQVLAFQGDFDHMGDLAEGLEARLRTLATTEADKSDNPVHDAVTLPANLLGQDAASALGAELSKSRQLVQRYESAHGRLPELVAPLEEPLSTVRRLITEQAAGMLPPRLMQEAQQAAAEFAAERFLAAVERILQGVSRPDEEDFLRLADFAGRFGLDELSGAVLGRAREVYPKSGKLREAQLTHLAHSADPVLRERARHEITAEIGLKFTEDGAVSLETVREDALDLLGILADVYQKDAPKEALKVTGVLVERFPEKALVAAIHARACSAAGRFDEALKYYRSALCCGDTNDQWPEWLGSELHNKRRHVDAVEAYLYACLLDPDDAKNFAHVADDLILALDAASRPWNTGRKLTAAVEAMETAVKNALRAALSCELRRQEDLDRCGAAARRLGITLEELREPHMNHGARLSFAVSAYREFESDLTRRSVAD